MDTIFAKGGFTLGTLDADLIEGSDELDKIFASFGDDVVNGYGGDDTITAGDGDDTVDGGAGDDTLDGGKGNDLLTGSFGADTFLFKPLSAPGQDIITDFNLYEDKLVFDLPGDFSKFNFDASVLDFTHNGNDVIITLDHTDLHITLQNLQVSDVPLHVSFI